MVIFLVFFGFVPFVDAYPINTFITVPVAKGGYQIRSKFQYNQLRNDDFGLKTDIFAFPQIFIYGIADRFVVFGVVPLIYGDFNVPGFLVDKTFGVGDVPIAVREDIFRHQSHLQNIQFSLSQGIEIPSGDHPFTSNSIDFPFLGWTFTWQTAANQVDADMNYRINTQGDGIDKGDELFHDVSYSRRLFPWTLPEEGEPTVLNLVLELNGHYTKHDTGAGDFAFANSGGYTLLFSPGVNIILPGHMSFDVGGQIPIVQDLNGVQLDDKFNVIFEFNYAGAFF